ncbi:ATP-dependent metallopeptidase FtsH/Yme1/Tma family protein, partial [Campylobacter lari]|nr:ATP-dependent metallopeptidase FtsH/Yme1/Tma family protein [Campylobacter lari]
QILFNETYTNAQADFLKIKELINFMENFDMIDENFLQEQKQEVKEFLELMKIKVEKLANFLLENEKIEKKDVENIIME